MEDELCYSSVSFKPFNNEKSTVPQIKESVLYGEVKRKQSTTETSAAECSVKESHLPGQDSLAEEKERSSPISPAYKRATVFLGLLCFLLLAAVTAVSVFSFIHMSKYNNILAQYAKERDANLQLLADKEVLEQERAKLMTLSEQINSTLLAFLHKSSFVVGDFCQSSGNGLRCTPCSKNWIQNGSSCYFFYRRDYYWKTWEDSQRYCTQDGAQLATIDSLEEQEFINQHTTYYYDVHHGYWIGLSKNPGKNWVWTTGANLTTGFWIYNSTENCVLSMPSNKPLRSWNSASCFMYNRWICEVEALAWPTYLQAL